MGSRSLDKGREDSEKATADTRKAMADCDRFGREALERFASEIEKSGMPGASETAAAMRRAAGKGAEAQLGEAQSFVARGGGTSGIGIGSGSKAEISAGQALGNDMLASGSSKTSFGSGIDLGFGLDMSKGSEGSTGKREGEKNEDMGTDTDEDMDNRLDARPDAGVGGLPSKLGRDVCLRDRSESDAPELRTWLTPQPLDPVRRTGGGSHG